MPIISFTAWSVSRVLFVLSEIFAAVARFLDEFGEPPPLITFACLGAVCLLVRILGPLGNFAHAYHHYSLW